MVNPRSLENLKYLKKNKKKDQKWYVNASIEKLKDEEFIKKTLSKLFKNGYVKFQLGGLKKMSQKDRKFVLNYYKMHPDRKNVFDQYDFKYYVKSDKNDTFIKADVSKRYISSIPFDETDFFCCNKKDGKIYRACDVKPKDRDMETISPHGDRFMVKQLNKKLLCINQPEPLKNYHENIIKSKKFVNNLLKAFEKYLCRKGTFKISKSHFIIVSKKQSHSQAFHCDVVPKGGMDNYWKNCKKSGVFPLSELLFIEGGSLSIVKGCPRDIESWMSRINENSKLNRYSNPRPQTIHFNKNTKHHVQICFKSKTPKVKSEIFQQNSILLMWGHQPHSGDALKSGGLRCFSEHMSKGIEHDSGFTNAQYLNFDRKKLVNDKKKQGKLVHNAENDPILHTNGNLVEKIFEQENEEKSQALIETVRKREIRKLNLQLLENKKNEKILIDHPNLVDILKFEKDKKDEKMQKAIEARVRSNSKVFKNHG